MKRNEYAKTISLGLFERCPKSVFAAIAVSKITMGGDLLSQMNMDDEILYEWWALYRAGIVT